MDKRIVIEELHEMMADPILRESARILVTRIEDDAVIGKIIVSLLEVAENGGFK